MQTKKELRIQIKEALKNNRASFSEQSKIICNKILESQEFKTADFLLAYMPLFDEVDLSEVIETAFTQHKTVALPKIKPDSNIMNFYKVSTIKAETLYSSEKSYGILEPEECPQNLIYPEKLTQNTLILVPGRAFSKDGARLGRGKGFYDIWLSKIPEAKKNRVLLAGICFSQQIVEQVPVSEHDIKMDILFSTN